MANIKYTYTFTPHEDYSVPNNNYDSETDYIIVEPPYDFMDWLNDNGVQAEQDGDAYYVLDIDGDRTGESYFIVSTEPTDELWMN